MQSHMYYKDKPIDEMVFPDACVRHVGHLVRNVKPIPGYKAIVDRATDRTFAIVSDGYNMIRHEEVIEKADILCKEFPEYGVPTREVWMSRHGGVMKVRYTFYSVDFEIGKLPDGEPDIVHPTMEVFCSYDTSLAQHFIVGGFRTVCTNGMVVGKLLAKYKKKHTASLDLEAAREVIARSLSDYSEATNLWVSYTERNASISEVNAYEEIGFNKDEKLSIERSIKEKGKVIKWDDEEPKNREVQINAWELFNILTAESSHKVTDVTRQTKINGRIAASFS